ncbi:MAG: 3-hydroxyacyl-CoA dehydrogenase/enoyl-CoA hydratase family protein [Fimbriimonadaceae bacterium]|nr:3-hydroxyacyl-CoA dehydrogenase/enoyl-CoA hydratase family protein [Fimbriimonadaceae bacterium]QYK59584.1 MAG: 3-hydroxyacyl-CoA dehydrogenase/enoyl-CoA hydratase family protein [Fimbriimonadaceae bacterium]
MVANPQNVVVIGAGTMGSGIAAHLANLGFQVSLLDVSHDSVREAFERAKRARPPHFYVPETAETVRLGSIEDDIEWVREADWVCEAIVEKLDAKKALFSLIEPLLQPDAYVSTNTSGLQISLLSEERDESFRRRFLGTHFFNPPRYLKLLELIPTPETDPAVVQSMSRFLEDACARRVVPAKDTPGFIANRFGMWSMYHATHCAERLGLTIEAVDAITGPFLGRPRSGSFRLNDLVGLDIMQDIAHNLVQRCPHDPEMKVFEPPRSLAHLLEKGWIGEKAGQGYYRREGKEFMSLDLAGLGYRMRQEPELPSLQGLAKAPLATRIQEGLKLQDDVGAFLRAYLPPTLEYAESVKEEISHSVEDFDQVMMWGFAWEAGPFALLDMVRETGPKHFASEGMLAFDGSRVPIDKRPEYATVQDFSVIDTRDGFTVRDMGDGVALLSTTTKMGVFSPALVASLSDYLESAKLARIVLTSEQRVFSAGFDLKFIFECAESGRLDDLDEALAAFQRLGLALGRVPSVAAVYGLCLGGGLEMATSCARVAALAETQIGFPEAKVGLVPGGGGCALMRVRHQSSAKALVEAAKALATGAVASNADEARKLGYLRREDVTVYHPDRLLSDAKRLALEATPRQEPAWAEVAGPVSGMIDKMLDDLQSAGEITNHDHVIGDHVKHILAKSAGFEDALAGERRAFRALVQDGLTVARIKHMLETGKPLRN